MSITLLPSVLHKFLVFRRHRPLFGTCWRRACGGGRRTRPAAGASAPWLDCRPLL